MTMGAVGRAIRQAAGPGTTGTGWMRVGLMPVGTYMRTERLSRRPGCLGLVGVPRVAALRDHVQVERGRLQAGAGRKLAHELARDLLPGCLVQELRRAPGRTAARQL